MAWPKGKKRDPNQKHGGGRAKKVTTPNEKNNGAETKIMDGKNDTTPITQHEEVVGQESVNTQTHEPSMAAPPAQETHANFIAGGVMSPEQGDADFIKALNLGNEDPNKYKHQEEYNTFAGNVKPRGEHANIKTDPSIQEVPEYTPPLTPPPAKEPARSIIQPNPGMNDLSAVDKEKAAAALVEVIFNVWSFIKMAAGSRAGINIERVKELAAQAKLDLNSQIPIGPNEFVTFAQMIESFNTQAPTAFVVSDDFKNKVREPMIREFVKRNIGLTDLQLIAVYWGIEIITTGYNFFDLKKQGNRIIENQMEIFKQLQNRPSQSAPTAAAPAPDPVTEKKTEPATEQPKTEFKEPEEKINKDL